MIKLVVSDMDGTLINHESQISKRNLEAIHQLQDHGIEFAIASGRDYSGVRSILDQYDIECSTILGNGAQYCNNKGKILMSCYLNKQVLKDIVAVFQDAHIPYMIFTTQGFYTGHDPQYVQNAFIERGIKRFGSHREDYFNQGTFASSPCNHLIYIEDMNEFLQKDLEIIKVEAFSLNPAELIPTKEQLKDIPTISYLSSFDDNVEITDENAQKGFILEKVAKIKKLQHNEIAVLGDGMNDLTLFQCFPYSFAPANAETEIKRKALKVVSDCQDDGFSEAIDTILKDFQ